MNAIERQIERDKKVADLEVQLTEVVEKLDVIISALDGLKKGKK